MHHLTTKKKLIICLSSILVSCSPQPQAPVFCHQWTKAEKLDHYKDDIALSPTNSLHDIIKDYERVCGV